MEYEELMSMGIVKTFIQSLFGFINKYGFYERITSEKLLSIHSAVAVQQCHKRCHILHSMLLKKWCNMEHLLT